MCGTTLPRRQTGAALLLLLGIIVLLSSGIFIDHLGQAALHRLQQDQKTTEALFAAKQALIGWAVGHPNVPGLMPWTDRNGDGNYDGDSDCASLSSDATFNPSFLLGRIPWRGRTTPCEETHGGLGIDVKDSAGERLWYAVSRNLIRRYQSPAGYPTINPTLANTAPFPWLTVRDATNASISNRVAAVILAPGSVLNDQDRSAYAPDPKNYLDIHASTGINNADADDCFDNHTGCDGTEGEDFVLADADTGFNDQLIFITIDELMRAVEKRVLNEVDKVLDDYRKTAGQEVTGVYPWMSPFAYPTTTLSSDVSEDGTDTTRHLIDSNADFMNTGIRPGQVVRNLTDGSKGIVETVNTETMLTLTTDGLRGGEDNRFDVNHISDPDDNDRYEILMDSSGLATDGSSGNTLEDTNRSVGFDALGIRIGDILENVSDETYGVVAAQPSADTITLARLGSDDTMAFDPGDSYEIPRFNGVPDVWEGHLPFHAMGERFRTGFTIAWHIPEEIPDKSSLSDNAGYLASLENAIQCSDEPDRAETDSCDPDRLPKAVPWADGSCAWQGINVVRCEGQTEWISYLTGTITETDENDPLGFQDDSADFQGFGVEQGDIVLNQTDGSRSVIEQVTAQGIRAFALYDGVKNHFETGDEYQIRVAAKRIPGQDAQEEKADCADVWDGAATLACGPGTLVDIGANFWGNGVRPGDAIQNRSQGWWGIIEAVGEPGAFDNTQDTLRVENASDAAGAGNHFADGDAYVIRSGFVDERRYAFDLAFTGEATVYDNGGLRHVETGSQVLFSQRNAIHIQDRDTVNQRIVVDASITTHGATLGEIKVSGIQRDLEPNFPSWFLANHWHHFIYVAASPAYLPQSNENPDDGNCIPNNDCLTLRTENMGGTTNQNDVRALVIAAGLETDGENCPQNRPASDVAQYLEGENIHPTGNAGDLTFQRKHPRLMDACFRDQAHVIK
uniref:Uncharacterized protein n=1 Tax=Candidatus Kentrum eta TaxID=2126337 RepID=A0A450VCY1_9GAMM|nr:MAG: hypothetical protein BECKH772B_GA0070898_102831 [Candidatus Kentron sp. H]VFK02627.1 MAG: hypothetical protein BECKH772A_GA0070896_102802 [Candidatus Kentron sp. H]VFK05865.1 MAG: hypothetical protein BECKH772C_GA0070978_103071 [Candidatus Kentron sp. H]